MLGFISDSEASVGMTAPQTLSRRGIVCTLGTIAGTSVALSTGVAATTAEASQYVAVVDRIVDGEFVVLLLEDDGELVDQHIEPASEMDVEEGDLLQVVLKDDAVLTYQHISSRPGESADTKHRC